MVKSSKFNSVCSMREVLVTPSYTLLVLALDWLANSSLFTLFQVAFGLLIAFSTSLEGSAIEMKPAAPVPVDTTVGLKA